MKALIIIDMFVRDVESRYDKNKLIKNQLKIIKAFKNAKQKVIVVGGNKSGKSEKQTNPVMLKLWGNENSSNPTKNMIISELMNLKYDYYVIKSEYSAFFKTKLEAYCKKNKITELYLAGISSGCCVYFTAADAAMRGIFPILISDASGSPDDETHKKNQDDFKTLLGEVVSSDTVINRLEN
jgi:isochorismate hydrolase